MFLGLLSSMVPSPPSAQPSLHLPSTSREQQWALNLLTPLPTRGFWAQLCSHSVPLAPQATARSLQRVKVPALLLHPQKLGRFHPGFCPNLRHKCCCLLGAAWTWLFPEHLNPHSFWGGGGKKDIGRAARAKGTFIECTFLV